MLTYEPMFWYFVLTLLVIDAALLLTLKVEK